MELLLSLTMLLSSANALAQEQEQESDFSQPGASETHVYEEYGPVHSALQEPAQSFESEMKDTAAEVGDDFSRTVPEPRVAKGLGPTEEAPRKIAKAKHAKKSKPIAAKAKHQTSRKVAKGHSRNHGKKGRSLASVKKKSKKTTMAKRGSSQTTLR